jgi:hypothetical protein
MTAFLSASLSPGDLAMIAQAKPDQTGLNPQQKARRNAPRRAIAAGRSRAAYFFFSL